MTTSYHMTNYHNYTNQVYINIFLDQFIVEAHIQARAVPGPPWPEKKIIYNNLKFFIYLPLKKKIETPSKFFYTNKIKFWWIICSTFKQKEKAQKIKFELKSKKKNCNRASPSRKKKPNINSKQNQPQPNF